MRKTTEARRYRWTICFEAVPDYPAILAFVSNLTLDAQRDDIYSARIGLDYRALAVMKKDRIVWYCIGSHSEYDRFTRDCVVHNVCA